jgi:hypothetical protein
MKMIILAVALLFVYFVSDSYALECIKAPEQVKKDWEVEVNAAVARIGVLKGPELKTKTKNAIKDLLGKLPDAGKIYLEQMMFSAYCTALRDDKTVKESEKAKLLKEYRNEVMPVVKKVSSKKASKKTAPKPDTQPKLQLPRFSEKVEHVFFSLGENGITMGYSKAALEKAPNEPFLLNNFRPVKVYVKNEMPYVDVKVYGGSEFPPLEIKDNKILNKPPSWDFNSNDRAMEIVNENHVPMYQFYYKTPSHIVLNGIFPFPNGLILASEKGVVFNPTLPATFKLNRIFKYPSWKFPGVYE